MQSSVSANRPARKKSSNKLLRVCIEFASNGVEITKEFEPARGKDGYPMYTPTTMKDKAVFDDAASALKYLGDCLKAAGVTASEASEPKGY